MSALPHSSIVEYLDGLNLQGTEQVNIYLAAKLVGTSDWRRGEFRTYDFSLPIEVNRKLVSEGGFPLAQVLMAPATGSYGTEQGRVQALQEQLRAGRWYPAERILEPFLYEHRPLRLESSMSSDSTLYVFSGLVDIATKLSAIVEQVTLVGREIEEDFLSQLHSLTQKIFQGYRIRTLPDLDLLANKSGKVQQV